MLFGFHWKPNPDWVYNSFANTPCKQCYEMRGDNRNALIYMWEEDCTAIAPCHTEQPQHPPMMLMPMSARVLNPSAMNSGVSG